MWIQLVVPMIKTKSSLKALQKIHMTLRKLSLVDHKVAT